VPLGKRLEILEEFPTQVGAQFIEPRSEHVCRRKLRVVAHVAKYRVLSSGRQRIAEQPPLRHIGPRPWPLAGQELYRILAHPFAAVGKPAEHRRRALRKRGNQVPQLHCGELNGRCRAEDHIAVNSPSK
jgi:hypothetical protein